MLLFTKVMQESPGGVNPDRVADGVSAAAVTPRPAIRADVAAVLVAQPARAEPGDPAWADLAGPLVAAFLAHISDLPSEFSPDFRAAGPKTPRKAKEAECFAWGGGAGCRAPDRPAGGGAGDGAVRAAGPADRNRDGHRGFPRRRPGRVRRTHPGSSHVRGTCTVIIL